MRIVVVLPAPLGPSAIDETAHRVVPQLDEPVACHHLHTFSLIPGSTLTSGRAFQNRVLCAREPLGVAKISRPEDMRRRLLLLRYPRPDRHDAIESCSELRIRSSLSNFNDILVYSLDEKGSNPEASPQASASHSCASATTGSKADAIVALTREFRTRTPCSGVASSCVAVPPVRELTEHRRFALIIPTTTRSPLLAKARAGDSGGPPEVKMVPALVGGR